MSSENTSLPEHFDAQNEVFRLRSVLNAKRTRDSGTTSRWIEGRTLTEYMSILPALNRKFLFSMLREKKDSVNPVILELGCGEDATALKNIKSSFNGFEAIGITLPLDSSSPKLVEENGVQIRHEDIIEFLSHPENKSKHDVIISVETFRHLPDPLLALELAYDALKPGGYLQVNDIRFSDVPLLDDKFDKASTTPLLASLRSQLMPAHLTAGQPVDADGSSALWIALQKPEHNAPQKLSFPVRRISLESIPKDKIYDELQICIDQGLQYCYQLT